LLHFIFKLPAPPLFTLPVCKCLQPSLRPCKQLTHTCSELAESEAALLAVVSKVKTEAGGDSILSDKQGELRYFFVYERV
jgi:hypothetical protein